MQEEELYLAKCRDLIEAKLSWGKSSSWQQQDFERLSDELFSKTKVLLSASTLKRVWGKIRYDSAPSAATLNALAQYAGYENWRVFVASNLQGKNEVSNAVVNSAPQPASGMPKRKIFFIAGIALALAIVLGFAIYSRPAKKLLYENLSFSNKPVTVGLPNTVVFQYDASHSNADSVFIQLSWDKRLRFKVDKRQHEYTSTYYIPGYYRAKLVLNDSIVKEQDVYIESAGWTGMVEKISMHNEPPVYLQKDIFSTGFPMEITARELAQQKIDIEKDLRIASITKVDKTIDVAGDHFSLVAELQNTTTSANGVCKQTSIRLFGTESVIDIPLCRAGCIGEIGMMIGMQYIDGKTKNLSAFGVDFNQPATVICETGNGIITIGVNNKLAYRGEYKSIGRIVGAKIRFLGTGVLNKFELKSN